MNTSSHCTHPGGPAYCKSDTCPGRARYLDFKKNAKPAESIEDFSNENAYANYETHEAIQNEIDEIFNFAYEIEFANHGDGEDEWLTIQDLMDNPELIRGNCLPASEAIIENMMLGDDFKVSAVELKYERGVHAAINIVTPEEENLVLDFTMRQFDSEAPMPFLGKREEWEARVDGYITNVWLDRRVENGSL